jgi:YD repeat-containing protein
VEQLESRRLLSVDYRFASAMAAPALIPNAVATDPDGTTYVVGEYTGTATFPGSTSQVTSAGGSDIFLAKYSPSGTLAWVKSAGGTGDDRATGIVSDGNGHVYVTGSFSNVASFSTASMPISLTSAGMSDAFVAKFDVSSTGNGNCTWAYSIGSTEADQGAAITADGQGHVYVTGSFSITATIHSASSSTTTLTSAGLTDFFVAKYTDNGSAATLTWAAQGGGALADSASSIAVSPSGNVYVTGTMAGTIWFQPGVFAVTGYSGSDDVFLAAFNGPDGHILWADALGGSGPDHGTAVTTDPAGNIYLAGSFAGTGDFAPSVMPAQNLTSLGLDNGFVAKYTSIGACIWADLIGGTSSVTPTDLAFEDGGIVAAGSFRGTAHFDPQNSANAIITSAGERDGFVDRLSAAGTFDWMKQVGGENDDVVTAIAARDWSHLAIVGTYLGNVTLKTGWTLPIAGSAGGLVAQLTTPRHAPRSDYNNDGWGDPGVFQANTATWTIQLSSGGGTVNRQWGINNTDVAVPGDYDGDGKTDYAVFDPPTANWYIWLANGAQETIQFGAQSLDWPVPGDYDGDGTTDLAVYRPTTGDWYVQRSTLGGYHVQLGQGNLDVPAQADYDGDGKTDVAVFRPTTAEWFINQSTTGSLLHTQFGTGNQDRPIPADYEGIGKADIATFRPTTAQFIINETTGPVTVETSRNLGTLNGQSPIPVAADFDSDGKFDPTVFNKSTAGWTINQSSTGTQLWFTLGSANVDTPLPAPPLATNNGGAPPPGGMAVIGGGIGGGSLGGGAGALTPQPPPQAVSITSPSPIYITEGGSPGTITVTRVNGNNGQDVQIPYNLDPQALANDPDLPQDVPSLKSGVLDIPANATSATLTFSAAVDPFDGVDPEAAGVQFPSTGSGYTFMGASTAYVSISQGPAGGAPPPTSSTNTPAPGTSSPPPNPPSQPGSGPGSSPPSNQGSTFVPSGQFGIENGALAQGTGEGPLGTNDGSTWVDTTTGDVLVSPNRTGLTAAGLLPEWRSNVDGHPTVLVHWTLPAAKNVTEFWAQLQFDNPAFQNQQLAGPDAWVDFKPTATLAAGQNIEFALQHTGGALLSGTWNCTVNFKVAYSDATTATSDPTNPLRAVCSVDSRVTGALWGGKNPFGTGWWIPGLDQLILYCPPTQPLGVTWLRDDGTVTFWPSNNGTTTNPPGALFVLNSAGAGNQETFTLTGPDNVSLVFDHTGLLTSRTEHGNLTTRYTYVDGNGDGAVDDLATVTDPYGRVTTYQYQNGHLSQVVDFAGRVATFTFDASATQLQQVTFHDLNTGFPGLEFAVQYFTPANLASSRIGEIDLLPLDGAASEAPRKSYILYDANGHVTRETDPTGFWLLNSIYSQALVAPLDPTNPTATYTDPLNNTSFAQTDSFGNVMKWTDALGRVTSYTRDATTDMVKQITGPDPDGAGPQAAPVTKYQYASFGGRIAQVTLPDGSTETWNYANSSGVDYGWFTPTSYTDENGHTTTYQVNPNTGFVTNVTDPLNRPTDYVYNSLDLVTQITGPDPGTPNSPGRPVTTFTYNSQTHRANGSVATDLPTAITYPDGSVENIVYDAWDRPATVTDVLGRTTLFAYDAFDRPIQVTQPNPNAPSTGLPAPVTTYRYGAYGELVAVFGPDPDGSGPLTAPETDYAYDGAGNVLAAVGPAPSPTAPRPAYYYAYDAANNLIVSEDPNGNITRYAYDQANRLADVVDSTGRQTHVTHDGLGRVTATQDPSGLTTAAYDNRDRVVSASDARGAVTQYTYDAVGNLLSSTDPLSHTTSYSYDAANRLVQVTLPNPGTGVATAVYNFSYDNLDRPIQILGAAPGTAAPGAAGSLPRPETDYNYGLYTDHKVTVTEPDPDTNPANRPVTTSLFDAAGNLTQVTDPMGRVTSYSYDVLNRLTQVTQPDPGESEHDNREWSEHDNRWALPWTAGGLIFSVAA